MAQQQPGPMSEHLSLRPTSSGFRAQRQTGSFGVRRTADHREYYQNYTWHKSSVRPPSATGARWRRKDKSPEHPIKSRKRNKLTAEDMAARLRSELLQNIQCNNVDALNENVVKLQETYDKLIPAHHDTVAQYLKDATTTDIPEPSPKTKSEKVAIESRKQSRNKTAKRKIKTWRRHQQQNNWTAIRRQLDTVDRTVIDANHAYWTAIQQKQYEDDLLNLAQEKFGSIAIEQL